MNAILPIEIIAVIHRKTHPADFRGMLLAIPDLNRYVATIPTYVADYKISLCTPDENGNLWVAAHSDRLQHGIHTTATESLLITHEYDMGVKHGMSVVRHKNGHIIARGQFVRGYKHGDWVGTSENANGKSYTCTTHYIHGRKHGQYTKLNSAGKIKRVENYCHGKLNGDVLTYNKDGILTNRTSYHTGVRHGEDMNYRGRDPHHMYFHCTYLHDKPHGRSFRFLSNGNISSYREYRRGKRHGRSVTAVDGYYNSAPNNTCIHILLWKNDKLHGLTFGFCYLGICRWQNYRRGRKHGLVLTYKKHIITSYSRYNYGRKCGLNLKYKKNGTLKSQRQHHDGILVSHTDYNIRGRAVVIIAAAAAAPQSSHTDDVD